MKITHDAPGIEGLIASPVLHAHWSEGNARSWDYYHPSDCRPTALRINVMRWESGANMTVRLIEGDGRMKNFTLHGTIKLPDFSSDEKIAGFATQFMDRLKDQKPDEASRNERFIAGKMTTAGFYCDDFYGSEAWLRDADQDGMVWFVRSAGDVLEDALTGEQIAVPIPGDIDPERPVEIGIERVEDGAICFTVAPSLNDALRIYEERKLPYPAAEEERVVAFETLNETMPLSR